MLIDVAYLINNVDFVCVFIYCIAGNFAVFVDDWLTAQIKPTK